MHLKTIQRTAKYFKLSFVIHNIYNDRAKISSKSIDNPQCLLTGNLYLDISSPEHSLLWPLSQLCRCNLSAYLMSAHQRLWFQSSLLCSQSYLLKFNFKKTHKNMHTICSSPFIAPHTPRKYSTALSKTTTTKMNHLLNTLNRDSKTYYQVFQVFLVTKWFFVPMLQELLAAACRSKQERSHFLTPYLIIGDPTIYLLILFQVEKISVPSSKYSKRGYTNVVSLLFFKWKNWQLYLFYNLLNYVLRYASKEYWTLLLHSSKIKSQDFKLILLEFSIIGSANNPSNTS